MKRAESISDASCSGFLFCYDPPTNKPRNQRLASLSYASLAALSPPGKDGGPQKRRHWSKHWFVLRGDVLYEYEAQDASFSLSVTNVRDFIISRCAVEDMPASVPRHAGFHFQLVPVSPYAVHHVVSSSASGPPSSANSALSLPASSSSPSSASSSSSPQNQGVNTSATNAPIAPLTMPPHAAGPLALSMAPTLATTRYFASVSSYDRLHWVSSLARVCRDPTAFASVFPPIQLSQTSTESGPSTIAGTLGVTPTSPPPGMDNAIPMLPLAHSRSVGLHSQLPSIPDESPVHQAPPLLHPYSTDSSSGPPGTPRQISTGSSATPTTPIHPSSVPGTPNIHPTPHALTLTLRSGRDRDRPVLSLIPSYHLQSQGSGTNTPVPNSSPIGQAPGHSSNLSMPYLSPQLVASLSSSPTLQSSPPPVLRAQTGPPQSNSLSNLLTVLNSEESEYKEKYHLQKRLVAQLEQELLELQRHSMELEREAISLRGQIFRSIQLKQLSPPPSNSPAPFSTPPLPRSGSPPTNTADGSPSQLPPAAGISAISPALLALLSSPAPTRLSSDNTYTAQHVTSPLAAPRVFSDGAEPAQPFNPEAAHLFPPANAKPRRYSDSDRLAAEKKEAEANGTSGAADLPSMSLDNQDPRSTSAQDDSPDGPATPDSEDGDASPLPKQPYHRKRRSFDATVGRKDAMEAKLGSPGPDGLPLKSPGIGRELSVDTDLKFLQSGGAISKRSKKRTLKIWIGSWNMGTKPFKEAYRTDIHKVIPSDYHIYVFGVQECISHDFYNYMEFFLKYAKVERVPIPARVTGRGDGSFLYPKFTGIAVFVRRSLKPYVYALRYASCSRGVTEGSKGGAAVALKIFDTTIAFMSVHLSAKSVEERRQGFTAIMEQAGSQLGDTYFPFLEQFHHVVVFGDLNFRTQNISVDQVMDYINRGDLRALRQHDEFKNEIEVGSCLAEFKEPRMAPDFLPTYKKHESRKVPTNYQDPHWAGEVYRTLYKEPWYKSGKHMPRCPSYCDRILYHSVPDQADKFKPEERTDEHFGLHDNYCSINESLSGSDHSAIYGTFTLQVRDAMPRPLTPEVARDYTVVLQSVRVIRGSEESPVRYVRVLFPGPFELGHDAPQSMQIYAQDIGAVDLQWTGVENVGVIHFQMKVKTQNNESGNLVVGLRRRSFENNETLMFVEPLMRLGGVVKDDKGAQLFARFSLQLSVRQHRLSDAGVRAVLSDL